MMQFATLSHARFFGQLHHLDCHQPGNTYATESAIRARGICARSMLTSAVVLSSAYHLAPTASAQCHLPSENILSGAISRSACPRMSPDTLARELFTTDAEFQTEIDDRPYARVRELNKYANVELELLRVQDDNRQLRERMNPKRRATFLLPFAAVSAWTIGKIVSAPDFDLPGLDSFKEYVRSHRVDPPAELAMDKYFPNALGSYSVDHMVANTLYARGYTSENTLFATSTCPDEVNTKVGELTDLFKLRWGENFGLGGLGGVPFTGKAGFSAYSHHVPDGGKMFIVFAPHVGVEFDGKVGALRRVNQEDVSTACGAAIGAYNGIVKDALASNVNLADLFDPELGDERAYGVESGQTDAFDAQIIFIKERLRSRLKGLEDAPDKIAYVTYAMYQLVREFFIDEAIGAPGFWDYAGELTVLGGIMINRGKGGDRFMPLLFQTRRKEAGSTVDLFEETFGKRPDLLPVLGEKNADLANNFYNYDLETTGERFKELQKKRKAVASAAAQPAAERAKPKK